MSTDLSPTLSRSPHVSTSVGRYRRWHVDGRSEGEEKDWLITDLDVIALILVLMVLSRSQPKAGRAMAADTQRFSAGPARRRHQGDHEREHGAFSHQQRDPVRIRRCDALVQCSILE